MPTTTKSDRKIDTIELALEVVLLDCAKTGRLNKLAPRIENKV